MVDHSVRDTTIYDYNGEVLNKTTTYNLGTIDSMTLTALAKKTMTQYAGNQKGEEIADYTLNYKGASGSESISTSSVYFYGATNLRASALGVSVDTAMNSSNT